jgi:hypothetical protein
MWQQHDTPLPYGITNQEPPLTEFLDASQVIVLIEREEGALKMFPFPTLESEKRDLVKGADVEKLLAQLHVSQNAPTGAVRLRQERAYCTSRCMPGP